MASITNNTRRKAAAFTLVEMIMAMAIMAMIALSLAMLGTAVEQSSKHTIGHGNAIQHARVCLERIERNCREAQASEKFPGFAVFTEQVGIYTYPDTLVVWKPSGAAIAPDGLPRFHELIFYFPNPAKPGELLEVTTPGDTRKVPDLSQNAIWATELTAIKGSNSGVRVVLTHLLHTATTDSSTRRAAVRFQSLHFPSATQLSLYRTGVIPWSDLPTVQGIKDKNRGMAQNTCRIELFLVADDQVGEIDYTSPAVPFYGSAAIRYLLVK